MSLFLIIRMLCFTQPELVESSVGTELILLKQKKNVITWLLLAL